MEALFFNIAIGSTFIFVVQLFFMFVMGGIDMLDVDVDVETEVDNGEGTFKIVSFQTIVTFMMMFGWSGLTFLNWGLTTQTALVSATFTGFVSMVGFAWLASLVTRMNSGNLQATKFVNGLPQIGTGGSAYQAIPEGGYGLVIIGGEEFQALNLDGEPIPAFAQVKVIAVYDSHVGIKKA